MAKMTQTWLRKLLRVRGIYNDWNLARAAGQSVFITENYWKGTGPEPNRDGWAVIRFLDDPAKHTKREFGDVRGKPWREGRAEALAKAIEHCGGDWERSPFGGYHPAGTVARVLGDKQEATP